MSLEPYFVNETGKQVGEVWFETVPGIPLLVKFIFTTEKLSVQVHPDDDYAREHENSRGKTEMWHIVRAEPEAKIAAGFRQPISEEKLRDAAISGEIENLLDWHEALPGDTFFIPAGTVHAIGPGLTLCEIQQESDITYRLYDYNRGRELHLDHGVRVSRREPHSPRQQEAVCCAHFTVERVRISGPMHPEISEPGELWIALEGAGSIGGEPFQAGQAWHAAAGSLEIAGEAILLRATIPAR